MYHLYFTRHFMYFIYNILYMCNDYIYINHIYIIYNYIFMIFVPLYRLKDSAGYQCNFLQASYKIIREIVNLHNNLSINNSFFT